jgi:hypothetical protein
MEMSKFSRVWEGGGLEERKGLYREGEERAIIMCG